METVKLYISPQKCVFFGQILSADEKKETQLFLRKLLGGDPLFHAVTRDKRIYDRAAGP